MQAESQWNDKCSSRTSNECFGLLNIREGEVICFVRVAIISGRAIISGEAIPRRTRKARGARVAGGARGARGARGTIPVRARGAIPIGAIPIGAIPIGATIPGRATATTHRIAIILILRQTIAHRHVDVKGI